MRMMEKNVQFSLQTQSAIFYKVKYWTMKKTQIKKYKRGRHDTEIDE